MDIFNNSETILKSYQNISEAYCREVEKLEIGSAVSDRISFLTPGDSIIKREK